MTFVIETLGLFNPFLDFAGTLHGQRYFQIILNMGETVKHRAPAKRLDTFIGRRGNCKQITIYPVHKAMNDIIFADNHPALSRTGKRAKFHLFQFDFGCFHGR